MIYEKYPQWDIDVEKGTVYSFYYKKYVGHINKLHKYVYVGNKKLHHIIWECINGEIPKGYEIHHIDGNKENNSIYNLEMLSIKNHHDLHQIGRKHKTETIQKLKINNRNNPKQHPKSIAQYTLDGDLIKVWVSSREVERELGFSHSNIVKCCKGLYNQSYNFIWNYIEEKDVA